MGESEEWRKFKGCCRIAFHRRSREGMGPHDQLEKLFETRGYITEGGEVVSTHGEGQVPAPGFLVGRSPRTSTCGYVPKMLAGALVERQDKNHAATDFRDGSSSF